MSKSHTYRLCSIALLSALSIVFNAYSINILPDVSISFTYLISFISGVFLGPIEGFTVGVIGDLIGCVIAPKGPYAVTVTLSSGLLGVIPWIVFRFMNKLPKYVKIILSFVISFIICSVLINTTTWYIMYSSKAQYFEYLISRNTLQVCIVGVNCAIMCAIFTPIEKILKKFGFYQTNKLKEEIIENDSAN